MEIDDDFDDLRQPDDNFNGPDRYNHPPAGDELATVIFEQEKKALLGQIDDLRSAMKATTDPGDLVTMDAQLNTLLTEYAITYRHRRI